MTGPSRRNFDLRSAAVVFGTVLCALRPVLHGAIAPSDWRNQQTLEISQAGLTKVALPDSTLDLSRAELLDLRLLGPNGEEVPYAIQIPAPASPTRHSPKNVRIELQPLSTQITIETGTSQPADGVTLTTPSRAFVKAARMEISANGRDWELIGQGFQIARQPGLEALTLPLSKTSAGFIRITIADARSAVVPFTGAILSLSAPESFPMAPVDAAIAKRDEFAGETVLTIDLRARHLPLTLLEIATRDPLFARSLEMKQQTLREGESTEQTMAAGAIFRSPMPQSLVREHLRVPLDYTTSSRQQQIHIANGDSPPLAIDQVKVMRRPVWLIFHAAGAGSYRLLTGNPQVSAPTYDVAQMARDWHRLAETSITISEPQPNPAYRRSDALADTPFLGAPLEVSAWKFRKAITPAATGVQELELDPEALAQAQPTLGDLRLVREGRQVPYLLERSSLVRSLTLQPIAADDPKAPRMSRWKLPLPLAGLPVQRLTLSSPTALFNRSLQIHELLTDERGETRRRLLTDRIPWSSTPDRIEVAKHVDLARPLSDALYLEIDNGDNPPIALSGVQAQHPVVRLFFRAPPEPLHLYYGAANATPPKYDIELVARSLLSEERHTATLGPEERVDGRSSASSLSAKRGGILLWVSLVLVVGVLLFAIGRLLPKPPEPAP